MNQDQNRKRFNQQQYELLMKCSNSGEIEEWNEYMELYGFDHKIELEGADFSYADLKGAYLAGAHLEGADFHHAHLEGANFAQAHLEGADLSYARLDGAEFFETHIEGAKFEFTHLERANFLYCYILKTFDSRTTFYSQTNFSEGIKQSLEYNNRRMNWEDWYTENKLLAPFAKPFWLLSDYGRSTSRLIASFLGISFLFALLYAFIPGVVNGVAEYNRYPVLLFLRVLCFSIVTMTTLGFGDITAVKEPLSSPDETLLSIAIGHILITLQVINGYVILGALVTRLSILFTSDGPAHLFEEEKKQIKRRYNYMIKPIKYLLHDLPLKYPFIFVLLFCTALLAYLFYKDLA